MADDDHGEFPGRTYLYIRTHPADNGTEPLPAQYPEWQSPDITIVRPGGVRGTEAVVGEMEQVEVIVTNAGGIPAVDAFVEAFVGDPATVITPFNATPVGSGYLTILNNSQTSIMFPWTPPPDQAGHRCLLARVMLIVPPDSYRNGAIFEVRADRHVAQRNVNVVALSPNTQRLSFGFRVVNALAEDRLFSIESTEVKIGRNIKEVREAIGLSAAQFGTTPLSDIRLLVGAVVRPDDRRRPPTGVLPRPVEIERTARSRVNMAAGEVRSGIVTISRNPNTRRGDFHVVQVAQVDVADRRTIGGIWIAVQH